MNNGIVKLNNRYRYITPGCFVIIVVAWMLLPTSAVYAQNKQDPIRGFMIDAPRGTESTGYYFKLIDFCAQQGLNTIIFRLTDDEGSAYKFSSHPDLVMCPGAYTKKELQKLVNYAASKSIEIIPEVETFGHSRYIVQSPGYKNLNDALDDGTENAVCPVNDSTLHLMKDIITEVASLFPSKYLHIGCDETKWGGSALSKKALQTGSKNRIWADYVNKLNGYVKELGKQTIIWGDIPVYNENEVLDFLDKDIVIAEWNYWEADSAVVDRVAQKLIAKGFKVIGCPAVSWCKWGARIGEEQFRNISAYSSVYSALDPAHNLGIILTNWVPQKYLQYSQWDTYAIAMDILRRKGYFDLEEAIPGVVNQLFGVKCDPVWMNIFEMLYANIPQSNCADADSLKFFPWSDSIQVRSLISRKHLLDNSFLKINKLLLSKRREIRMNKNVFEDILVTVNFLGYLIDRQNAIVKFADTSPVDAESVQSFFKKVASEDKRYRMMMKTAWLKGRRAMTDEYDKDYMYSFVKATDFSKKVAENPSVFLEILRNMHLEKPVADKN